MRVCASCGLLTLVKAEAGDLGGLKIDLQYEVCVNVLCDSFYAEWKSETTVDLLHEENEMMH